MAKQLNQVVNLSFTADASSAKAEIAKLQELLKTAVNTASNNPLGITEEINDSIKAASRLSTVLEKAVNPKTGNLNLGNFNQELSKAGLTVDSCADKLASLGPTGEKAFVALAQSVVSAEVPIKRTNTLLSDFAQTLKNTAKWQISSSIIHGFMGSLSSAFGYAQDLNKSLTDIRIVTGESAEQMAEFAKQANASAQALSTTTLAYTDASLIFFQQGQV